MPPDLNGAGEADPESLDCKICGCPHDDEIHGAVLRIREWFRNQVHPLSSRPCNWCGCPVPITPSTPRTSTGDPVCRTCESRLERAYAAAEDHPPGCTCKSIWCSALREAA